MEIKVVRKIDEDGRYVSEISIPEELWRYAAIRRELIEELASAGVHFEDPLEELRIQRPRIILFAPGPYMSLLLAEVAVTFGVAKALEWITKEKVELDYSALHSADGQWEEGEFSIPIPLQTVPA